MLSDGSLGRCDDLQLVAAHLNIDQGVFAGLSQAKTPMVPS